MNTNESAGNPSSYQSAMSAVASVVAQKMLDGTSSVNALNYEDVISIIYGIDKKKVMDQIGVLIQQKFSKLKQRQGVKETGHIKLSEMLTQMGEGEEEKLGGAAYDREDAIERGKKIKCQCGKQFVPSYGEYKRCPSCLSKQHSHGEKSTGVQEGEEEKLGGAAYDREDRWEREQNRQSKYSKPQIQSKERFPLTQADKADLAKMSPEDQRTALNCMKAFNSEKGSSDDMMNYAIDLEAINKKYGTDVGNVTRK